MTIIVFQSHLTAVASLIARFMGPTWDLPGADRTQVGPMLAPWTLLSGVAQQATPRTTAALFITWHEVLLLDLRQISDRLQEIMFITYHTNIKKLHQFWSQYFHVAKPFMSTCRRYPAIRLNLHFPFHIVDKSRVLWGSATTDKRCYGNDMSIDTFAVNEYALRNKCAVYHMKFIIQNVHFQ